MNGWTRENREELRESRPDLWAWLTFSDPECSRADRAEASRRVLELVTRLVHHHWGPGPSDVRDDAIQRVMLALLRYAPHTREWKAKPSTFLYTAVANDRKNARRSARKHRFDVTVDDPETRDRTQSEMHDAMEQSVGHASGDGESAHAQKELLRRLQGLLERVYGDGPRTEQAKLNTRRSLDEIWEEASGAADWQTIRLRRGPDEANKKEKSLRDASHKRHERLRAYLSQRVDLLLERGELSESDAWFVCRFIEATKNQRD